MKQWHLMSLVLIVLQMMLPGFVSAASLWDDFDRANALYEEETFAEALAAYEKLMSDGAMTAQVLGNAANAAYQSGDKGRAVLYYTRALRLDPRHDMARQNLSRIEPRTNVSGEEDVTRVFRIWLLAKPSWVWLVIVEVGFLGSLALMIYAALRARSGREFGEWTARAGGLLFVALVAGGLGVLANSIGGGEGDAVVMTEGIVTRTGPGEKYIELLSLPAGTVIHLPDAATDGWVRYRLRDGRTGFISTDGLQPI